MKLIDNYDTLIVIGAWNKAVFTPEWVTKYIFDGESTEIEFPINNLNASLKYKHKNIAMYIIDQRLIFNVAQPTPNDYKYIYERLQNIIRALPHTPVSSFGVNHIFECPIKEATDNGIFNFKDLEKLEEEGYKFVNYSSKRTLQFNHHELNIIWTSNDDKATLEFNNHYQVSDFVSMQEILASNDNIILDKKDKAIDFIKNIYNITVTK